MSKRRSGDLCNILFVLAAAALLSACSHAQAVTSQPPPETPASETPASASSSLPVVAQAAPAAPAPTPAAPMTRERASTDCWMKYEKEGRGLSLDQRLPLVEKCTAEKLKATGR